MKRIVLMPTKNDDWILQKTLQCIMLWADYVLIADQKSSDKTLEICQAFPKVRVIINESTFHSTKVRQMLLDEARKIPGNNIIFSIDSDEVVTANVLEPTTWKKIESFPVGTAFEMQWVQLWKNTDQYRDDSSVWSNSYKHFGFIDDRKASYNNAYALNDHNPRVPADLTRNTIRLETPKVLHYQFVNWDRMLSKQRFYRVQDFIQTKRRILDAAKINKMYYYSRSEKGLRLSPALKEWTAQYLQHGVDLHNITSEGLFWYDIEVLRWFKQFGVQEFAWLDIWDVNWESKRQQALFSGHPFNDPRAWPIKVYHSTQGMLYALLDLIKT